MTHTQKNIDSVRRKAMDVVSQMTLDEKASLCSGADIFQTKGVKRLGIPSIWLSDGPYGLRKQEYNADSIGKHESNPAVCFPAGCTCAATFDPEQLYRLGEALGESCLAEDIHVILGPAVNIKRSPLCGRNFEYFSEDPLVAGKLASAYINGVQSKGVGTSIKHFFANNQETLRRTSSSNMDERTMHEIYLSAFERAVKTAKPWTVMTAYNKINGVSASENKKYLTDLLREEWGFGGLVVSDWTAVNDRIAAVRSGCDLTMPAETDTDHELADAVMNGTLPESEIDTACQNIIVLVLRAMEAHEGDKKFYFEKWHDISRQIEEEAIVLLKNEGNILPLTPKAKIAFIGKFADSPRYQGAGSSRINPYKITSAMEAVKSFNNVLYEQGYAEDEDIVDETLKSKALMAAEAADIAVVFAGLPENIESEGIDRADLNMPESHNDLIESVCAVQPNTVVVLHNGAPVEMPWLDRAKGVLEAYLGGEAVGEAVVNVLFGKVNPSGRLPETFPKKLEHNPSYLYYIGEANNVEYREGVFVGYRYYETKRIDVLFPFGFGLSYTTFEYTNLQLDKTHLKVNDTLKVSADIKNTGDRKGKETVQLYVGTDIGATGVRRPVRELRAFKKIELAPGERKTLAFELEKRDFSYWDIESSSWQIAGGAYSIQIGRAANCIVMEKRIEIENDNVHKHDYSMLTTIGEVAMHPAGKAFLDKVIPIFMEAIRKSGFIQGDSDKAVNNKEHRGSTGLNTEPLKTLKRFLPEYTDEDWQRLFDELNA